MISVIWCVEDDDSIRDIEVYTLNSTGFKAKGFPDGASMRDALAAELPELIILDVMLPNEDGVALLEALRANPATSGIPIIMATAKGQEIDIVRCLDSGADDYLVKPFGMMEMVSRVRAVLRRAGPRNNSSVLRCGELTLNTDERTAVLDGERLQLTLKEFELLRVFLTRPGMVFTRDRLMNDVWGVDYAGETRTVDMHITTLRQKLGDYGRHIVTVRGVGYKFEGSL